jgi:predicted acetyltransferase
VRTRRATPADFDAVCRVYDTWAAAQNGPLTRRGPAFPADAQAFIDAFTGVTLAVDDAGEVIGFASWHRGQETGDSATLEVVDLLAIRGDAYGALWHVLGSFGSVVGQVRLCTSGHDVARLSLPSAHWKAVEREPYMLRVHDVPGAFAARHWPVDGDVAFSVAGDHLGTTNGAWRLVIERGKATCVPAAAADGPVLTPGGLALAWAGAQTCVNLRMAGHLSGGIENDEALDRVLAPRPIHIRDSF